MKIGKTIEMLRRERSWSRGDLSAVLGESVQIISSWERGDCVPEMDRLIHLSQIFEIPLEELVGEEKFLLGRESPGEKQRQPKKTPAAGLILRLLLIGMVIALGIAAHVVWFRYLIRMTGG